MRLATSAANELLLYEMAEKPIVPSAAFVPVATTLPLASTIWKENSPSTRSRPVSILLAFITASPSLPSTPVAA